VCDQLAAPMVAVAFDARVLEQHLVGKDCSNILEDLKFADFVVQEQLMSSGQMPSRAADNRCCLKP